MKTANTTIQLSAPPVVTIPPVWCNLEQKIEGQDDNPFANMTDIMNMFNYSQSGLTASLYNTGCAVDITDEEIIIPLIVYVWPHVMDLNYTLRGVDFEDKPVELVISPKKRVQLSREDSLIFELTDTYAFEHLVTDDLVPSSSLHLTWETPCYNKFGEVIQTPDYEVVANEIRFSTEIFGVARVKYTAIGYEHTVSLVYENSAASVQAIQDQLAAQTVTVNSAFGSYEVEDSNADTNVKITISDVTLIVSFAGGGDSTDLIEQTKALEIPESVSNCLSQCDDGSLVSGSSVIIDPGDPEEPVPETETWTDVYYNACNGNVLDTNSREVVVKNE